MALIAAYLNAGIILVGKQKGLGLAMNSASALLSLRKCCGLWTTVL